MPTNCWPVVFSDIIYLGLTLQIRELNWSLDTEKASRTDLEMYVGVLNTQKTALIDDADNLRSQLNEGWFLFISPMQALGLQD